jgi:hypothetical protein
LNISYHPKFDSLHITRLYLDALILCVHVSSNVRPHGLVRYKV